MKKVQLVVLEPYPTISPEERRCPRCGSTHVYGHGWRTRRIRDWQKQQVTLRRFRCAECGATWTVYPQGVSPGSRFSLRAEQLMVLLYLLGLSYRKTAAVLHGLGVPAAPSKVLREVQAQGMREEIEARKRYWQGRARVKVIGVDGTGVPMAGNPEDTGVVVVVDEESGLGLWVEAINEQDVEALGNLLTWVLEKVKPEEVVSDEGSAYPQALQKASIQSEHLPPHRLCAAHFRRNKVARLRELQQQAKRRGWGLMVMELRAMESLLRSPPEVWGSFAWRLLRMMQKARPPGRGEKASWAYRYRQLLLDLGEKAHKVTGITNNRTEQLIGRAFKVRVGSMRGFKREDNRMRFLQLALAVDRRAQREGVFYLF